MVGRLLAIGVAAQCAAACSFEGLGSSGDDGGDDGDPPGVWRIDTEAELAAPGAWFVDAVTAPAGSITVGQFFHGGLRAAGRTGCGIGPGQQASIPWADVTAAPAVGRGYGVPAGPFADGVPAGLGLAGDAFTAWWDGELWLEPGTHAFELAADDRAFLQILALDGWHRIAAEGAGGGELVIATAGWYPVQIALAECGGGEALSIRHRAPAQADALPLSEARLRAVVNGASGLVVTGFDDRALLAPVGMAVAGGALVDEDWSYGRPADLGITDDETYSVRWTGQLRIDAAGDYTFHVRSDNGHRLRIDGQLLLEYMSFGGTTEDRVSPAIALSPGWHDVVVDYQEDTGAAVMEVEVASGPDLVGQPIPAERLRPMPGPAGRLVTRTIRAEFPITDFTTTTVPIRIDAPAGAVIDRINVGYTIAHSAPRDLVITLVSPAGATRVLRSREYGLPDLLVDRWIEVEAFAGGDPSGTWELRVEDAAAVDVGAVQVAALTVHYAGGPAAQPAVATWTSPVHALGPARSLDRLEWDAATPGGTTVALAIRTCAAAEACVGPFVPVAAPGDAPDVAVAPFVQLQATLTPAGDELPVIDAIELDYTP